MMKYSKHIFDKYSINITSYKTLPWDSLLCYDEVVDALLIEYITWEPLSCYNITDTITQNILLSLRVLHRAGIVHRDLENDNGHVLVNKDNRIAFVSEALTVQLNPCIA